MPDTDLEKAQRRLLKAAVRAESGKAVGSINQVIILAAACARQPSNDTEAEIRACVEEGLTR